MTLPLADDLKLLEEAAAKMRHVMEHGPRLTKHSTIYLAAKCKTGKHELHGGLGAMGVGEMWATARPEHQSDPVIWDALPVQDCSNFGITDACQREPMTHQELANAVCWRLEDAKRNGANVPRWLMIIETPGGLEVMGCNQDVPDAERREWLAAAAERFPRLPAQKTADT